MEHPNPRIRCSVATCAHHSGNDCCTLDQIRVGCCGCSPKTCESTECASFQLCGSGPVLGR